ncbi:glucocorticoid modulatory element-binding protein 1-like [Gadus chalcogrammus]|uniref:glucocorticoid modulatory element-binding protein 1-like n=1 Tax=Gadus chalcogrammus TaxID=1042646 RepID=UPI0024C49EB5|nr:glucocorticoid modulatory element-binding protein 1-like [Gadus chalcogrammus]
MEVEKEDEEKKREDEDIQKTQVNLQLHPGLHRLNDDMSTTVLAIQAHHGSYDSTQGEEIEYGYPITCGDSRAVLLFKKFVCPGINIRCVKFHDQLISPKQFAHLAGKATLKDWKRAIRVGGVMLRKMMHSGQIDFYQHDTVCTNTCRSTKFDVVVDGTGLSPGRPGQRPPSTTAPQGLGAQPGPLQGDIVHGIYPAVEQKFTMTSELSSGLLLPASPSNRLINRRKRLHAPDGVWSFWKAVANSGLMSKVLSSIQTQLEAALTGLDLRMREAQLQAREATMLHSLCEMLGLLDSVENALDQRHAETDQQNLDRRQGETDHQSLEQRGSHPEDSLTHNPLCVSGPKTGDQEKCFEEAVSNLDVSSKRMLGQHHPPSRAQTPHLASPGVPTKRIIGSLLDPGAPPQDLDRLTPKPLSHIALSLPRVRRHTAGVIHRVGRGGGDGQMAALGGGYEGTERGRVLTSPPREGNGEKHGTAGGHRDAAVKPTSGNDGHVFRRGEPESWERGHGDGDGAAARKRALKKQKRQR